MFDYWRVWGNMPKFYHSKGKKMMMNHQWLAASPFSCHIYVNWVSDFVPATLVLRMTRNWPACVEFLLLFQVGFDRLSPFFSIYFCKLQRLTFCCCYLHIYSILFAIAPAPAFRSAGTVPLPLWGSEQDPRWAAGRTSVQNSSGVLKQVSRICYLMGWYCMI